MKYKFRPARRALLKFERENKVEYDKEEREKLIEYVTDKIRVVQNPSEDLKLPVSKLNKTEKDIVNIVTEYALEEIETRRQKDGKQ